MGKQLDKIQELIERREKARLGGGEKAFSLVALLALVMMVGGNQHHQQRDEKSCFFHTHQLF